MRVSLFITCLVDQMFPEVGEAMVTTLRRLGVEEFQRAANVLWTSRLSDERQLVGKVFEICAKQCGEIALSGTELFGKTNLRAELVARGLAIFTGNDVELVLSIGVHGPKELYVILVD